MSGHESLGYHIWRFAFYLSRSLNRGKQAARPFSARLKRGMKPCGYRALLLAGALAVCGYGQEKGVEPDWDIRPVLKEIAAHAQRLTPALEQIDAKGMVQNGAPETYASQIAESKVQAKALATEALALANSPDKLSADL